ncbi:PEP-CTERM sorting domain-containing protein [Desulfospira joergensenii]|uniref:PEP-CTERM sorting domain-containing protein n=1 Tax=Desulfospira joergensenii TaxID=53329 RepID=UPI0003B59B8E|nr:PEP-CTERM sorting domain-containing protein [Desulfospira joergensenii]
MKKLTYIFTIVLFVFVTPINLFASTIYLGTYSGNDPASPSADLSALENIVSQFLGYTTDTIDLEFYAKVEFQETETTDGSGGLILSYNMDDGESKSGTWSTEDLINLFSVKAGNMYALYWIEDGARSGVWDTADVADKGISHLSTWKITENNPPAIYSNPEPTTMLLLGFGLLGLAGISRRKK